MDKIILGLEWLKLHWDVVVFLGLYLVEQVLPKLKSVEANSMSELIPELFKLIVKLVKKDYSVEKKDEPN